MASKKQSPYVKYGKTPFRYNSTPLHRQSEGVDVTPRSVAAWEARIGLKRPEGKRK